MMFFVDVLDNQRIVRVIGKNADDPTTPEQVVKIASDWITSIGESRRRTISAFYPNISGGAHIVAVPRPNGLIVLAVVPVADVEARLLGIVNRSASTGTMLVDDQGTFVSASLPGVRGKKISDLTDPRLRELA